MNEKLTYIANDNRLTLVHFKNTNNPTTDWINILPSETTLSSKYIEENINSFFPRAEIISNFETPTHIRYISNSSTFNKEPTKSTLSKIQFSEYENIFLSIGKNDYLDYGEVTAIDRLVESWSEELTRESFVDLIAHLHLNLFNKIEMLLLLYKAISNIPYSSFGKAGYALISPGLLNPNIEVKDATLRVFEQWESKEYLPFLSIIEISPEWLNSYKDKIVNYISNI